LAENGQGGGAFHLIFFASTMLGLADRLGAGNGSGRGGVGSSLSRIARSALVRGAIGQRVVFDLSRQQLDKAASSSSSRSSGRASDRRFTPLSFRRQPAFKWIVSRRRGEVVMEKWQAVAWRAKRTGRIVR